MKTTFDYDKAHAYVTHGKEAIAMRLITKKEYEIMERWETCFSLIKTHGSKKAALPFYQARYPDNSLGTAYQDFADMEVFWGNIVEINKDFQRHLHSEKIKENARKLEKQHKHDKAADAWSQSAKVLMLDKEDPSRPPTDKIQPPTIFFISNPQLLEKPATEEDKQKLEEAIQKRFQEKLLENAEDGDITD